MKEQILEDLKKIIENEKFKMDAFFLCGAATSAPSQNLQTACEKYLECVEAGHSDAAVTATLIKELEAAIERQSKTTIVGDLANSSAIIEEVYRNKALL